MSTFNYDDLYEEFLLLTSSSSSSPTTGDQSFSDQKTQLLETSQEQMPDSVDPTAEQHSQFQPPRSSVISTAGIPAEAILPHDPREVNDDMNSQVPNEGQIAETNCTVMQKEMPGNADELRKLLSTPTLQSSKTHQFPIPFMNQQYPFAPQHFLSQCSPSSPNPSANIAWGQHHMYNPQMNSCPPQNPNNYFSQQPFMGPGYHVHMPQQSPQLQMEIPHTNYSHAAQMNQQYQQQQQQILNSFNMRSNHWDNQPFPGGLSELWRGPRGVPIECQKYLTPQDIPESARFRGYFTVCELLVLKRNLLGRRSCPVDETNGEEMEKSSAATSNTSNSTTSKKPKKQKRVQEKPVEGQCVENGEIANCESATTIGVAVKEALDALAEQQSQANANTNPPVNMPVQEQDSLEGVSNGTVAQILSEPHPHAVQSQNPGQRQNTNAVNAQRVPMGPPPPYRSVSLVFRLLQIGNYHLRSFADLTPNKLKVLYNSQRVVYECQLPIVLPQRDDMQPLRKILTIEIGFDQISCVRFGNDKMFLRVEGTPLLTVSYNAITDDETSSPVNYQEQQLLDQIDRGQLRLSPCHQVFFINERLVHMLESQFRDHPRLHHLLLQTPNCSDVPQIIKINDSNKL